MSAYTDGDYTSVPNYVTSAVTFTPRLRSDPVGHWPDEAHVGCR
jgi:hypothetical protein